MDNTLGLRKKKIEALEKSTFWQLLGVIFSLSAYLSLFFMIITMDLMFLLWCLFFYLLTSIPEWCIECNKQEADRIRKIWFSEYDAI